MRLKDYLKRLTIKQRMTFAERCGTTGNHLRNISYQQKRASVPLCIALERETGGEVRCEELRPDIDWQFLQQRKRREAEPA
jgi:DNA-binding transcriptional regulator YdaS (Cro superfamily)